MTSMPTREPLPAAPAASFRRKRLVEVAGERLRDAPVAPAARAWLKRLYHAALMLQTGGRGLPCRLPGGETVRALPQYRHLSWNLSEYAAFRAAVRPGMVALDIGANVGAYSMLLGQWVGPAGQVFAFEPAPEPFDGLVRHTALNRLDGVVRPIQSAVGAASTRAALLLATTSGEGRLAASADSGRTVQVPVTTVDQFCAEHHLTPDFIKIDVEGAELDVLRGARDTIKRSRGLALFVEMHPSIWPVMGVSKQDILDELAGQRLEPVSLLEARDMWAVEGVCLRLVPR
jgi:FkbM family methyltransferase